MDAIDEKKGPKPQDFTKHTQNPQGYHVTRAEKGKPKSILIPLASEQRQPRVYSPSRGKGHIYTYHYLLCKFKSTMERQDLSLKEIKKAQIEFCS